MRTQWNTGAHYTEHGQRIVAATHADGIIFMDHDRGIDGFIPLVRPPADRFELEELTNHAYIYGQYKSLPLEVDRLEIAKTLLAWETPK
jgi:hypothetical protein